MKVCQVCAVGFTLKHFLLPLIDGMKNEGWIVQSVCSEGKETRELMSAGYDIHHIEIARSANPILALISTFKLIKLFRKEKFDVVHVHTPVASLAGRLAAWVSRVPIVVYTAHGFYFHDDMPTWKRKICILIERIAGLWTDILFTQSSEDAETAVNERIMPKDCVLAIGNGVNVNRFNPKTYSNCVSLRASINIPNDAFVFGFIGRHVREKGIAEFLDAAQKVAAENLNVYFITIGAKLDSDHADGVAQELYATKEKLKDRFVMLGQRDDIPELLLSMDVFCLPSWREGMPRSIIEAMMMSKPVIATNIRGSREEVIHGVTGTLVPVRSSNALAAAMFDLLLNPFKINAYGLASRQRALDLYDEAKIIEFQLKKISAFANSRGIYEKIV